RLTTALAEFDDATIATTHEFCARMLDGLGVLARADPGREFTDSLTDLVEEVTADTYLRLYAHLDRPPLDVETAQWIARAVAQSPHPLVPGGDGIVASGGDPVVEARLDFADQVRTEVRRRKERLRLFTHDDSLYGLRDSLVDPHTGDDAV